MSEIAVRAEGLGKRYRLGHREPYRTLRESIVRTALAPFRKSRGKPDEEFWALRDVSFDLKQGEIAGVIGRNGAGKSTLLKILSRITDPTEGRAEVRGRAQTLLEVGTGFHPELTGRENVYLNGAILGMKRAEIDRKFDDIVAFAEVERFLGTPVKRYSSGMALRLAFAVAAHLEPEVLLVDEVLAVGDAAFQRKCLGKMAEVARGGRTVIFVSHHLQAIQSLCERALLLRDGRLVAVGPTREVLNEYLGKDLKPMTDRGWSDADAPGNDVVRIRRARIVPETRDPAAVLSIKTAFRIEITLTLEPEECLFYVGLHFLNAQGERIFVTSSLPRTTERGTYTARCFVPGDLLNNGAYRTEAYFVRDGNRVLYKAEDLLVFEVADVPRDPGGFLGEIPGAVRPQLQWEVVQETP